MRLGLLVIFGIIFAVLTFSGIIYGTRATRPPLEPPPIISPTPTFTPEHEASPSPTLSPSSPLSALPIGPPDFTVDDNGLSKTTVVIRTSEGVIKFKFYSTDAPKTVKRIAELIGKGFYNGLSFHRVVKGFVVQGGDPLGNGTGGSGQKLEAEFNHRKHVEGAVAMARAADIHSADSQFYISLGTHPHLDHSYTVFGQVIEGLDVAKKLKAGDKMLVVSFE